MKNVNENDVILRVKHLKQYFKFGTGEYKYTNRSNILILSVIYDRVTSGI